MPAMTEPRELFMHELGDIFYAENKLVKGRGNVIRQAEMLKGLGVKPSKSLPQQLVDRSTSDEDLIVVGNLAGVAGPSSALHLATSDGA